MISLRKITVEEYETRFPKSNQDYFNSLNEQEKEEYLTLYSLYASMLTQYLDGILQLSSYEKFLTNEKFPLPVLNEDDMDLYQYLGSQHLKYFYIRNNIYIERLTAEQREYLKQKLTTGDYSLSENDKDFISRTCLQVMLEESTLNKTSCVNYGPDSLRFIVEKNACIIGARYNNYFQEENDTSEEWHVKSQQWNRKLQIALDFMRLEFAKQKKLVLRVIEYDDFSVKSRFIDDKTHEK